MDSYTNAKGRDEPPDTTGVNRLVIRVLLLLPVCVGVWVLLLDYVNYPGATLAGWLLKMLFPAWVEGVEFSDGLFDLLTLLEIKEYGSLESGQIATLVVEANPSLYSFGLPLFVALMLASRGINKVHLILVGCALLIPCHTWGIVFDLLKQIAITSAPSVRQQADFGPRQQDMIALGYQFGNLILPTLAPVALWLAMNRNFLPEQFQFKQPGKSRNQKNRRAKRKHRSRKR